MWFSCTLVVLLVMAFGRFKMHLDYFRLLYFTSPGWFTLLWAPFQKERNTYRLVAFMLIAFLVDWSLLQSFPVQCRAAWGTRMVTDTSYWSADSDGRGSAAQMEAVNWEKDNFYRLLNVTTWGKKIFYPTADTLDVLSPAENSSAGMDVLSKYGPEIDPDNDVALENEFDKSRVAGWIAPLTGGESQEFLLLRAYCNLHRKDEVMPHIYPFKTLGLGPDQASLMVPCPYWSCMLTEARPNGKLPFLVVLGVFVVLNYFHYRCDCLPNHGCQSWFGSGRCRGWWSWFWATLLPLWAVMFIKTTYDKELLVFIMDEITGIQATFLKLIGHWQGQVVAALGGASLVYIIYTYREYIKEELGWNRGGWFLPVLFAPNVHPEDSNTFQVCIWRLDVQSDPVPSSPRGDGEGSPRTGGGWFGQPLTWANLRRYLPLTSRSRDTMQTYDGSVPALCVRFYYGTEEVQSTRIVKPTNSEWSRAVPVFFQETFRLNIDWRPRTQLRVEVRDAQSPVGHTILGSISFDEGAILREFDNSSAAQDHMEWHSVATTQVVRMLEPPAFEIEDDLDQQKQLRSLGFTPHLLSGGGSIWLAFAEVESAGFGAAMPLFC